MTKVYRQNKVLFYLFGYAARYFPNNNAEREISLLKKQLSQREIAVAEERAEYYNKISETFELKNGTTVADLLIPKNPKAYYFDTYRYARFFHRNLSIDYAFGDVKEVLPSSMICKTRPIVENNSNNVLLKLDSVRHFVSVKDDTSFSSKRNILLGRAAVYQQHRVDFFEKYFHEPWCDLGQVNSDGNPKWHKPKISIAEHLKYKYILSLEGNDVATNLKWIMSSNSIAVAPKMKVESWYMEGRLLPDVHYIEIPGSKEKLLAKLDYFATHEKEAQEIIDNANEYRRAFENKNLEDLTALLVLKRYFQYIR